MMLNTKALTTCGLVAGLCLFATAFPPAAAAADDEPPATFAEALKQGTTTVNLRYRLERVEDDAVSDQEALASTLRTSLGYASRPFHGVSFFIEFENVVVIGNDELFNNKGWGSLWNGVTDRPVVADSEITEVNQAYLNLGFIADTTIKVGREEIRLGNVRFIGDCAWRQNYQSVDAVSIVNQSIPSTTLTYVYVDNVNRITGENKPMSTHLLNGTFKLSDLGTLAAYAYLLDYEPTPSYGLSTATYGVSFTGARTVSDAWELLYDFEYAQQSDYADNPLGIDAGYYRVELGAGFRNGGLKVGYEVLEGSPQDGQFATPLGCLHKWNGWADKFATTPVNGLEDVWVRLDGKIGNLALAGAYHVFTADEGDADYGDELDLLATYKSSWGQTFAAKVALYEADAWAADTTKIMLWTGYKF